MLKNLMSNFSTTAWAQIYFARTNESNGFINLIIKGANFKMGETLSGTLTLVKLY